MIKDEGAVLWDVGLTWTQTDAVLQTETDNTERWVKVDETGSTEMSIKR